MNLCDNIIKSVNSSGFKGGFRETFRGSNPSGTIGFKGVALRGGNR